MLWHLLWISGWLQWKFQKATRQPTLFAVIVWRHTVWPLLYNVLGGWIFRREHAGSLVEQLLTGDHATHLQQLAICLLTYRVLFGLDSFACILLCSILVAAIQEIRAAVFRFFQETTSYAGTQMVAAAFDAGKRHQDKMLLETPGSRSISPTGFKPTEKLKEVTIWYYLYISQSEL